MNETFVRVRVGDEHYALPVSCVHEVAKLGSLTWVPGSGDTVLGLCNLRGTILVVYDLSVLLRAVGSTNSSHVVVVESRGRRFGLAVDEIAEVAEHSPPAQPADSGSLTGSAIIDDRLVGFIDIDSLVGSLAPGEHV